MSKKDKNQEAPAVEEPVEEQAAPETAQAEQPEPVPEAPADPGADALKEALARKEDQYLRLAAEYDNYRKRTAKEKESLGGAVRADTAAAFLPVYDNLERALRQDTADEAYKKGVEMTMNQLKEVFARLGITEIEALGKPFDPKFHNAVMHVEDEALGESVVAEVFQAGFLCGEKVVRCAMVKVAN